MIDIKTKSIYYDYTCTVLSALLLIAMYVFPDVIRNSASEGISICLNKVIPSLLPYIIGTKILSSLLLKLQKSAHSALKFRVSFWALLLGLLSGFPNGAILAASFYKNGSLSKRDAEILISCSNCISPAFCISVFGSDILNGSLFGFMTFISLFIVNITLYIIQRNNTHYDIKINQDINCKSNLSVITSSITEGMMTVINICAFVIYFMCFASIVQAILYFIGFKNSIITATITSLIEITCGIQELRELRYGTRFLIGNAVMGFGGLSAIMQVISVCNEVGLSARRFVFTKIVSVLAVPSVSLLLLFFMPSRLIIRHSFFQNINFNSYKQILILLAVLLPLFVTIMIFVIKRRKEYKKSKIIL